MSADASIVSVATIEIRLEPYDWAFPRDSQDLIQRHWSERAHNTPGLFDGRVLLMRKLTIEGDRLSGSCFEASYKDFLCWRECGFPGVPVANCFGMAALRSADGAFMLGEMNTNTASAGRLYFPAGTPEPTDVGDDGYIDLTANVLRELEEETGIRPDEVTVDGSWAVVRTTAMFACMKLIRSQATAIDLQARFAVFNTGQPYPELVNLIPVSRPSDYQRDRMPDFMPAYLDWAFRRDHAR